VNPHFATPFVGAFAFVLIDYTARRRHFGNAKKGAQKNRAQTVSSLDRIAFVCGVIASVNSWGKRN